MPGPGNIGIHLAVGTLHGALGLGVPATGVQQPRDNQQGGDRDNAKPRHEPCDRVFHRRRVRQVSESTGRNEGKQGSRQPCLAVAKGLGDNRRFVVLVKDVFE